MALLGVSLSAVTTTGVGTSISFDKPMAFCGIQVKSTGSPASYNVFLEATIDGTNWSPIAQVSSDGIFGADGQGNPPVAGLRANLTSLTGGSSPTITAWVSGAGPG